METGTDGNVYATVDGNFFKIDAVTKEVTVLATGVRKLAQDDFGSFYMFTNPETPNLYKYSIPDLLLKLIGVEVSLASYEMKVGDQTSLTVKGLLEQNRTTLDLDGAIIVYSSSEASVADIDNKGVITATQAGTTHITATITLDGVTVSSEPIEVIVSN